MEDNLYPRSSAYLPSKPDDRKVAEAQEKDQTLAALPIIRDVIARLDERIAFYDSRKSIPLDVRTDPMKHLIASNSNDQTAANLETEKNYLEDLVKQHA